MILKKAAILMAGTAMLSGCFMVPGEFQSTMDIGNGGAFTFTYDGQIQLLGLTQLARMREESRPSWEERQLDEPCYDWVDAEGNVTRSSEDRYDAMEEAAFEIEEAAEAAAEEAVMEAEAAMADDLSATVPLNVYAAQTQVPAPPPTRLRTIPPPAPPPVITTTVAPPRVARDKRVERECMTEELAARQERANEAKQRRIERETREAERMQAVFGGIDPTDPDAGRQIAERLEKQRGFEDVEFQGDGLFTVRYRMTGTLDRDFVFPMAEGLPGAQPFVVAYARDGGVVKVEAPGFTVPSRSSNSPSPFWMAMMDDGPGEMEGLSDALPVDGSFTITTTGQVLANNTYDGLTESGGKRRMGWTINSLTEQAPSALIRFR